MRRSTYRELAMSRQQGKFRLADLEGRIAVITGAGNFGIGWGLAKYAALNLHMHIVLIDLHRAECRA